VGLVVGASLVMLLAILVAPSRRIRSERPLPADVEAKILLGRDPDEATIPPPPRSPDGPRQFSPNEIAALQRLGAEQHVRTRRRRQ
jgi:hypothetical protein